MKFHDELSLSPAVDDRLVKSIHRHLGNAGHLGAFISTASDPGVERLALVVNEVTDPEHTLRTALHRPVAMYLWRPGGVSFATLDGVSTDIQELTGIQELAALENWFASTFTQVHKVIVLPEEEVLKSDSVHAGDSDGFLWLKSSIEEFVTPSSRESGLLPVVVFICKVNAEIIVHFESYLQASLKKYAEHFSRQRMICVFHVENLSVKECPRIDLGRSDCHVTFFSAFDPSEKPITLLIADVERGEMNQQNNGK